MAVLCSAVIFASVFVAIVSSFTITSEDPVLPTQQVLNDNSFLRTFPNNEQEVVECPVGTYLDKSSLICQFNSTNSGQPISPSEVCSSGVGNFANPENCRTFVACDISSYSTVTCPANLLYSVTDKQCEWPRTAECCEYIELNSSRLVQNSA